MPAQPAYHFINGRQGLEDLCGRLQGQPVLAMDTEFIRERSYTPKLELVQVAAADGTVAIIDYGTLGRVDGDPFAALAANPAVLKVFHAAEQDLEMLRQLAGSVIGPIWDTQLVTGLFPYDGRLGYAAVVETLLGVKMVKSETLTDWSRRPLAREQLNYAAEDVRSLLALYEVERERLTALGRLEWAREECERVRQSVETGLQQLEDDRLHYRRVRGWRDLDGRTLAILRELAAWREKTACEHDRPRGSIMRDELLCEIARRAPVLPGQLAALRGTRARDLERFGAEIVQAVKRGQAVPAAARPAAAPDEGRPEGAAQALLSLLQSVVQTTAAEKGVAAPLIATTADLSRLVAAQVNGQALRAEDCALLTGWRRELVGREIADVLAGRRAVCWDPARKALVLSPHQPELMEN